tara:strand:- start:250 stop:438 length:189 start_codon:yes stop_codon:yes gene_type:complete
MSLKKYLYKDAHGTIYYRKVVEGKIVIIDTRTKSKKVANKLHQACEYQAKFYSAYNTAAMLN